MAAFFIAQAPVEAQGPPPQPPTWPVVQFDRPSYAINENGGTITITVSRNGSTELPASVDYSVTGGTATPGSDFSGGNGTLRYNAGFTTASFSLSIVNDAVYEGSETINITLSRPVNTTIGNNTTTITISDNDAMPALAFSASAYAAGENAGSLSITVNLAGSTGLPASVNYTVTGGNATMGVDYILSTGKLTFAPGATTASFSVGIINDAVYEGSETITFSLASPVNATMGAPSAATVIIVNEDPVPVVQFSASLYSAMENAGSLTITASLGGSTSLPVTVSYAVIGGNATAGADYAGGAGTLNFAPGVATATFSVNVVNDAVFEGNETIVLSLSGPANATIGANASTTVTIANDDSPPVLRFNAATYTVSENAGKVTVSVTLTGSTALPASASYAVTGGNATGSVDYTGGAGTLSFSPGATTASFDVNIVDDGAIEGNETVLLALSAPRNATIGSPASTTVTVVSDDATALPTYNISLVAGWNLIALPLVPQDGAVSAVFPASVRDGIVDIWGWDESQQNWMYYSPDSNDYFYQYYPAITRIEVGKAYWVEMNRSASFTLQGTVPANAPDSPAVIVSGWNFVGPTGLTASTPAGMYPLAIDVWGWDPSQQNWVYYSPDPADYFYQYYARISTIQPGSGYWVEMA